MAKQPSQFASAIGIAVLSGIVGAGVMAGIAGALQDRSSPPDGARAIGGASDERNREASWRSGEADVSSGVERRLDGLRVEIERLDARYRDLLAATLGEGPEATEPMSGESLRMAVRDALMTADEELREVLAALLRPADEEGGADAGAAAERVEGERASAESASATRLAMAGEIEGLSATQLEELDALENQAIDAYFAALVEGASAETLAEIELEAERGVRQLLGEVPYRDLRRAEHWSAWSDAGWAMAFVGATTDQRARADAIVRAHIDSVLDDDIRLQTGDMSAAERDRLTDDLDGRHTGIWTRIAEEVLTPEQRDRIPAGS